VPQRSSKVRPSLTHRVMKNPEIFDLPARTNQTCNVEPHAAGWDGPIISASHSPTLQLTIPSVLRGSGTKEVRHLRRQHKEPVLTQSTRQTIDIAVGEHRVGDRIRRIIV